MHLNDKFLLKIEKISLQKQYFPGLRFPNFTFFHAWLYSWVTYKLYSINCVLRLAVMLTFASFIRCYGLLTVRKAYKTKPCWPNSDVQYLSIQTKEFTKIVGFQWPSVFNHESFIVGLWLEKIEINGQWFSLIKIHQDRRSLFEKKVF